MGPNDARRFTFQGSDDLKAAVFQLPPSLRRLTISVWLADYSARVDTYVSFRGVSPGASLYQNDSNKDGDERITFTKDNEGPYMRRFWDKSIQCPDEVAVSATDIADLFIDIETES